MPDSDSTSHDTTDTHNHNIHHLGQWTHHHLLMTLQGSLRYNESQMTQKRQREAPPPPLEEQTFILNRKSTVVRSLWSSFFVYLQYYSTVQYSSVAHVQQTKTQGGPRAQEGTRTTGTTRGTHQRAPQGRALRC